MSLELSHGKTWLLIGTMIAIAIALTIHVLNNTEDIKQEKEAAELLVDRHDKVIQYLGDINATIDSNR